jgi:hypothetical protein
LRLQVGSAAWRQRGDGGRPGHGLGAGVVACVVAMVVAVVAVVAVVGFGGGRVEKGRGCGRGQADGGRRM